MSRASTIPAPGSRKQRGCHPHSWADLSDQNRGIAEKIPRGFRSAFSSWNPSVVLFEQSGEKGQGGSAETRPEAGWRAIRR